MVILISITGLLPILSLKVPQKGAKIKFIREYKPAINPISIAEACNSFENTGSIGITNPKPSKSMKMVTNKIRTRFCALIKRT